MTFFVFIEGCRQLCSNLRSLNVVFTKVCTNLPNLTAFNPNMFGTCSGPVRDMFGFDVFSHFCVFFGVLMPQKVFGKCSGHVRVLFGCPFFHFLKCFVHRRAVSDWFGEV